MEVKFFHPFPIGYADNPRYGIYMGELTQSMVCMTGRLLEFMPYILNGSLPKNARDCNQNQKIS
jgi:hypothetical protein